MGNHSTYFNFSMCYPKGAHSLGHRWGNRLVDYKKGYFISVKFSKKIRNIAVFKYWHLFQILCKSLLWQPYIAYCKAILRKAILNASIIRIACPNYKSLFAYPLAERGGKNHLLLIDKIFRAKNRREVPHPQSFRHCPGTKSFNIGIQSWQYIKVNILEKNVGNWLQPLARGQAK